MKVFCKVAEGSCPQSLKICCHDCEQFETCTKGCVEEKKGCQFTEVVTDEVATFENSTPEVLKKIEFVLKSKKAIEEQEKALKKELVNAMEKYGVKSFENDVLKMVYVAPTTRSTIDSTRLKKDYPGIVEEYSKVSEVSASVRVTVK